MTAQTREEKERIRKAAYSKERNRHSSEIGKAPLTSSQRAKGRRLRKKCEEDLVAFNRIFKNSTGLKPFGEVQLESIAHDQEVILNGGRICKSEPRGYGKTVRSGHAALWAVLYGYRRMVPVFKSSAAQAKSQIIAAWKTEIRSTPELLWMFPDLIWPLVALDGVGQQATRQTYKGTFTHCRWTSSEIVFPHIAKEPGASAVLTALPLKNARGTNYTTADGEVLRPDFAIFDDVQNDEDAENPVTLGKIEDLIDHTAMRLCGHATTMSAIMNNTIRAENDLGERYHKKTGWRSVRYKMLDQPSISEKEHWLGEYGRILTSWDKSVPDDEARAKKEALAYYKKHRVPMDTGAKATWEWAYAWGDREQTEITAVQHAYNIRIIDGESVFQSECQNEPVRKNASIKMLTAEEIMHKQGPYRRGVVANEAAEVTLFVDVHPEILDWEMWSWDPVFTGWKTDDGYFPHQPRPNFTHRRPPVPLSELFPGMDEGARIYAALDALLHGVDGQPGLIERQLMTQDGRPMRVSTVGIDSNGRWNDEIKMFCVNSRFSAMLRPTYGRAIKLSHAKISQWEMSRGTNYGPEWCPTKPKRGEANGLIFDANYWKTRFHTALALPMAAKGSLYVYKTANPQELKRSAEEYVAELPNRVRDDVREAVEWKLRPNMDNHRLDCAVGCMMLASTRGIRPVRRKQPEIKTVKMSDRLAEKRRNRR